MTVRDFMPGSSPMTWGGIRIVTSEHLVDYVEDWSRVRSPARARRRRAKHPQNIVTRAVPKPDGFQMGSSIVMHPETYRKLRASALSNPGPGD